MSWRRRIARRVGRTIDDWRPPACRILSYHRIAEPAHDPWGLAVRPSYFDEHLQVLSQRHNVITVSQMTKELQEGTLQRGAVVISFDDGYADNVLRAKPMLERYQLPATMFLCIGLLDGRGAFWWDALVRILLAPQVLPEQLEIRLGQQIHRVALAGPVATGAAVNGRMGLYRDLWQRLRPLPASARGEAIAALAVWAGVHLPEKPDERPMSLDEAASLGRSTLIEIGAHTLTHPVLPEIAPDLQHKEISGSKSLCEEVAGRPVTSFAYPHGRHSPAVVAAMREAAFSAACTTEAGSVRRSTSPFLLPRLQVLDWNGEEFARRLLGAEWG